MLSRLKPKSTVKPSVKPSVKADAPVKPVVSKVIPDRKMANAEKFVGGRGAATGVMRFEKRGNGRVRTSRIRTDIGEVQDLSLTGCRICAPKKSKFEVGQTTRIQFTAEEISLSIQATVVWVRVMTDRTCHLGLRFTEVDASRRRSLLELLRTGVANEGLSRGWSPMAGFHEAKVWEE